MQVLEHPQADAPAKVEQQTYVIPTGALGLNIKVRDGKEYVDLIVEGKPISLTLNGARDLAMALRQSANRVEKNLFGSTTMLKKRRSHK